MYSSESFSFLKCFEFSRKLDKFHIILKLSNFRLHFLQCHIVPCWATMPSFQSKNKIKNFSRYSAFFWNSDMFDLVCFFITKIPNLKYLTGLLSLKNKTLKKNQPNLRKNSLTFWNSDMFELVLNVITKILSYLISSTLPA